MWKLQSVPALQVKSMVSRVALVGASNLVSFERQPWVACNCEEPCKNRAHRPQVPHDVVYKIFAKGGARFNHYDKKKDLEILFKDALTFRPHTLVIYYDALMNSFTLPPHAPPNSSTLTPHRVIEKLLKMQRNCPGRFVVVLCRRKQDACKLPFDTNRKKGTPGDSSQAVWTKRLTI